MKLFKFLLTASLLMISMFAMAQTDTIIPPTEIDPTTTTSIASDALAKIWAYLQLNWMIVLAFVYEAITRLVPNASSYSALRIILYFIDLVLPDRLTAIDAKNSAKSIGVHSVDYGDKREYPTIVNWLIKSSPVLIGLMVIVVGSALNAWTAWVNVPILIASVFAGAALNSNK